MQHIIYQIRIILKIILSILLISLFSFCYADAADEGPQKRESIGWKYKIGVDERFRYEYKHNFDFNKDINDNGSLFFSRFLVNIKASLSDAKQNDLLELFVEGLDARVGAYQIKPVNSQKDSFDLH